MKKKGLNRLEIVQMKKMLASEEPPSVKELANMFDTTTSIIRSFMPKTKPKSKEN